MILLATFGAITTWKRITINKTTRKCIFWTCCVSLSARRFQHIFTSIFPNWFVIVSHHGKNIQVELFRPVCVWGFSPLLFLCNSCNHDLSLSKCVCVCVCTKCREPAQFSPARIPRLLPNCVRNIFERHSNTHTHTRAEREHSRCIYRKGHGHTYLSLIRWTI